jgi:hypothetical protein
MPNFLRRLVLICPGSASLTGRINSPPRFQRCLGRTVPLNIEFSSNKSRLTHAGEQFAFRVNITGCAEYAWGISRFPWDVTALRVGDRRELVLHHH